MTFLEELTLEMDVEDGLVSKSDPRYITICQRRVEQAREWDARRERETFPQWDELLATVKGHLCGSEKELAARRGITLHMVRRFKDIALKQKALTAEEWKHCLTEGRKRKKTKSGEAHEAGT